MKTERRCCSTVRGERKRRCGLACYGTVMANTGNESIREMANRIVKLGLVTLPRMQEVLEEIGPKQIAPRTQGDHV